MPLPAKYGRTAVDGSSFAGAEANRDEVWSHMADNDAQQSAVRGGIGYANGQAAQQRGPQVTEDPRLAGNAASGAGGHQNAAIGLAGTLAYGQQPSQGAYQLQAGLNQASAQQKAMAAGARGSAALATAGSNQAANTAALQQNAWTQGGMLRSQDMAAGRGMLGSALGQARGQDQQRLDQANGVTSFNQGLNDNYQLGMGGAAVNLGGAANGAQENDFKHYQLGMDPINAQSEANQQGQLWKADAEKQKIGAEIEDGADTSRTTLIDQIDDWF